MRNYLNHEIIKILFICCFQNGGFNYFSLVTDLKGIEIMATAMEEELVELIGTVSNRVRKSMA